MNKALFILILITSSFEAISSRFKFQVDCEKVIKENIERRNSNKKFKIGYEIIKGNKREFLKETYDSSGNIISKVDHHFYKSSHFSKIDYSYNDKKQLIKIIEKTNFSSDYFDCTQITYKKDGKINSILYDFGLEGKFEFDTLYYFYSKNGMVRATFLNKEKDTIYYHYDENNKLDIVCRNKDYLPNLKEYDKNRCITLFYTQSKERFVETNDANCNSLTSEWQRKSENEKWYTIRKEEYKYEGTKIIEVKSTDGKKVDYRQITYNEKGEKTKEVKLNKRKKIIREDYFEFIY